MSRYTDAALLKGNYAKMLQETPEGDAWQDAACDNIAEAAATEIAKHIFSFNQSMDPEKERLEVATFSAKGLMKITGLVPGEGDLLRVDGMLAENNQPCSMVFHAHQLSLTFTAVPAIKTGEDDPDDDGMKIGFVIFDELKKRKSDRSEAVKQKKLSKAKKRVKKAEAK